MAAGRGRIVVAVVATLVAVAVVFVSLPKVAHVDLAVGDLVIRTQQGHAHAYPVETRTGDPVAAPSSTPGRRPRGVVLVIGDGMGIGQVSAGAHLLHGPGGGLAMESAPVTGLMRTVAADDLVTDSAASGSALATGYKFDRKRVSLQPDGSRPRSLFEAARDAGLATGAVTTSALVDATPATFLAHVSYRYDSGEILRQALASGTEVLVGGDGTTSTKLYRDELYRDLLGRVQELASPRTVVGSPDGLRDATAPVLALFPPREPGLDQYGPPLRDTAGAAYDMLASDPDGFVLLAECEATDSFGHDNAIDATVAAVREVDEAARALLARAAATDDVLVIVTADHDTGGLGVVNGEDGVAEVRWATKDHTAQWVPVFAWGPGAERFGGVLDNTDVGVRIADLLGLEGLPPAGDRAGASAAIETESAPD